MRFIRTILNNNIYPQKIIQEKQESLKKNNKQKKTTDMYFMGLRINK
jgi:hypothetical protein